MIGLNDSNLRGCWTVKDLNLQECCVRSFLCLFQCMVSERLVWREKERCRIRALQMNTLKGFLGIMRIDRMPNRRVSKGKGG